MRTPGNAIRILREQSPMTIAREAAWRARKRWLAFRFEAAVEKSDPAVQIRMLPYYRPNTSQIGDQQRQTILKVADDICRGRIPFLSYETQHLGLSPEWSRDFISEKRWPMERSNLLPSVRFDGSDVKVPWELSRLQFLPVLGKAHCLTGRPEYRTVARRYLEDWIQKNPVGYGVNWMVAMEAALRGISMIFLLNLMWPLDATEQDWKEKVTRSLWEHLVFIESHLEFSHIVRGNHYLSNLLGLLGLSLFLDAPGMARRRRRYRQLMETEILLQVHDDGGDYESSSGYHALVAQMFLTGHRLMCADGAGPSAAFSQRLARMFDWMHALADKNGRLPHIGDCDDGRVEYLNDDLEQMAFVNAGSRDSLKIGSLMGLGEAMLGIKVSGRPNDFAWYGLDTPASGEPAAATAGNSGMTLLRRSGIAVIGQGSSDLIFLAVPNGIFGKGTHTHNDKLSVILRMGGEEVLCDPGTGCYTRDGAIRDRFRSTKAHNTATVDSQEQNRIPKSSMNFFSLGNEARVSELLLEEGGFSPRISASHSGYSDRGVCHTRAVLWKSSHHVQFEDCFSGSGEHELEIRFHFGPGWIPTEPSMTEAGITCNLEGSRKILLTVGGQPGLVASREDSEVSWVYGTRIPSSALKVRTRAVLPASLITNLNWNESNHG